MHGEFPQPEARLCGDCSGPIEGRPLALYCDPCRAKRRTKGKKYIFTERMDEAIRKAYLERADKRQNFSIPNLTELAKKWNMPKWAVVKRAALIGAARTKEAPWSEEELRILEKFAWMASGGISKKLRERGFSRSSLACKLKLKRIKARRDSNTDQYSARGLADCFGIDSHAITRWINRGLLKAEWQNSDRDRDIYVIHEKDVRSFIFENPMEFDLRKVDQLWFMDLITDGKMSDVSKLRLGYD
jgi:hypothetical protein